jgi:DNA-binding NtrC family response regulator
MKNEPFGVLIVDDEFSVRDSLYHWFRQDGYRVATAESATEALHEFEKAEWDVVLLDIRMPGVDGMELQRRLRDLAPDTIVIMITAHGTIESAVEALKNGAFDYITKPVDPDQLSGVVIKAMERRRLQSENTRLREKIDSMAQSDEIVGESEGIKQVMRMVESLAQSDVTVLIRGESGTGKELVARAIHARSPRRYFPLVPVNCGAVPEGLLEAELFGHERGAFTGAVQRRKGRIEQADGGTLFLDEIGCISPRTQVDLLRVLDTKEVTRVGGTRAMPIDFRVVCATNQHLEELVKQNLFREDLFFRINVLQIDLPPLRERPGDIELLARHYLKRFGSRTEKRFSGIDADAMQLLKTHSWPGNVRELANAIERAVVLGAGPTLHAKDLPFGRTPSPASPADDSLAEAEKAHIARVLERLDWNISQAARALRVDRVTLYNKVKRYGLRK